MTAVHADRPPGPADELSYERTVDRRDVHRWALSEVFLTDVRPGADGSYAAAAQLPTSHAYYGDHVGAEAASDSMLLMECCRQAATYLGHHELGVARDSAFMVSEWTLDLTGPTEPGPTEPGPTEPGPSAAQARRPGRLRIDTTVTDRTTRAGVVRGARFVMRLSLDGRPIGHADIAARYTPAEEAALVRQYLRKTPPPMSTSLPAVPAGTAVTAGEVGRRDAANVALVDADRTDVRTVATVAVPPAHATHFDHPQDHYTAMTLMEAARQAALLALGEGAGPAYSPGRATGYRARFSRFAELDSPVRAHAVPSPALEGTDGSLDVTVPVTFHQDGHDIAAITVVVSHTLTPRTTR